MNRCTCNNDWPETIGHDKNCPMYLGQVFRKLAPTLWLCAAALSLTALALSFPIVCIKAHEWYDKKTGKEQQDIKFYGISEIKR
jgi:hypothetical protein